MNQLSLQPLKVNYSNTEIFISDYFVDHSSLQKQLRYTYKQDFKEGRFKELFMPILGRNFSNKLDFQNDKISEIIPEDDETLIAPIYGCHDNCCIYIFAEVSRKGDYIFWNLLGRNKKYVNEDDSALNILWLPQFKPLQFNINNYSDIVNALNQNK